MTCRNHSYRRNKLTASLFATAVLALAAPAAASAQEQEALSPEQQYAYTCGHLGQSCDAGDEARPSRRKARRACGMRSRNTKSRQARRSTAKSGRRCGARRMRARR